MSLLSAVCCGGTERAVTFAPGPAATDGCAKQINNWSSSVHQRISRSHVRAKPKTIERARCDTSDFVFVERSEGTMPGQPAASED